MSEGAPTTDPLAETPPENSSTPETSDKPSKAPKTEEPENPLISGLKQVEDDRKAQIAARKAGNS